MSKTMSSTKKVSFGLEVWRSQLDPSTKVEKYILVSIIIFTFITPVLGLLLMAPMLSMKDSYIIFLAIEGILGLTLSPLIIFSIRYFLSFLIIYEKGVVIREKSILKFWKSKFITYREIENIELGLTSIWKEPGEKVFIKKLIIKIKGKKPYQINSSWVKDPKRVEEILRYYLDKN